MSSIYDAKRSRYNRLVSTDHPLKRNQFWYGDHRMMFDDLVYGIAKDSMDIIADNSARLTMFKYSAIEAVDLAVAGLAFERDHGKSWRSIVTQIVNADELENNLENN